MQNIEKWRVKELALVLNTLGELLKKGNDLEWANVFFHFCHESEKIISNEKLNTESLSNLIRNTKSCFSGGKTIIQTELWHEDVSMRAILNKDFRLKRSQLIKILSEMEKSMIETIN